MAVIDCKIYEYDNTVCGNIYKIYSTQIVSDSYLLVLTNPNFVIICKLRSNSNKQSAGNLSLFSTKGSPETTRVISYNNNEQFGYYLAGLIDASGTIYISKEKHISIEITLHEKDEQTLYKIKSILGYGNISKRSNVKAYRIRIGKKQGVIHILNQINGKLITPSKIIKFNEACKLYSVNPISSVPNNIVSRNNAWFSGFFDGDGSISIRNAYTQTFSVGKKDKNILELIQTAFNCGHIYFDISWNGYIYSITDNDSIKLLISYFETYPLLTTNSIDIITFKRIILFKERQYHHKVNPYKYRIDNLIKIFKNRFSRKN